jgi:hypothetical protein
MNVKNDEWRMTNGTASVKQAVDAPGSTMVWVSAARGAGRQLIVVQGPSGFVRLCQTLEFLVRAARAVMNGAICSEITPSSTIFNEVQRLWAKNKIKKCGAGARPPPRGQPACFQLRRADGIGRKNEAKARGPHGPLAEAPNRKNPCFYGELRRLARFEAPEGGPGKITERSHLPLPKLRRERSVFVGLRRDRPAGWTATPPTRRDGPPNKDRDKMHPSPISGML